MNIVADRYQFRARIIPEFLTVLPLVILFVGFVENLVVLGFLSIALFFIFFQGHFSSRLGRKLQEKLHAEGKLPQNCDWLWSLHKKNQSDQFILLFKEAAKKSKRNDPFSMKRSQECDQLIDDIIAWLRANTREIDKFPDVFDKLCDYGFYRNMLAMKPWAIGILVISTLVLALQFFTFEFDVCKDGIDFSCVMFRIDNLSIDAVWLCIGPVFAVFWLKVISLTALKEANKSYIETLLGAVSIIQPNIKE